MSSPLLHVEGLCVSSGQTRILDDVCFQVDPGESVAIFGPSGAGKSTTLHAICGLLPYSLRSHGRIVFDRKDLTGASPEVRGLGGISMVPQSLALFPLFSVLDNISYPLRQRGLVKKEARARAMALVEEFHLQEVACRRPAQLSGGQQQRVALARALASSPSLLLLDEPLKGLDDRICDDVLLMLYAVREKGVALLLVSHNRREVALIADRVIFLEGGRIAGQGPIQDVLAGTNPPHLSLSDLCRVPNGIGQGDQWVSQASIVLDASSNGSREISEGPPWAARVLEKRRMSIGLWAVLLEFDQGTRTWVNMREKECEAFHVGEIIHVRMAPSQLGFQDAIRRG